MIALAARICHTPLSISFEPGDDRTAALASLGCPLKEEALAGFLKSMKNYERIRTCGADIPMEMYEEAARIDKYIATAKTGERRTCGIDSLHQGAKYFI